MLPKPPACNGCPMFQDGLGFVPDEHVDGAEVLVLGQNPGEEEERGGRPFVGKTGQMMEREFFPRANLVRGQNVDLCNAIRCRWAAGKDRRGQLKKVNTLPPAVVLNKAIEHCRVHFCVPSTIKLIVAQGALAWRALGQTTKITDWRGFLAPEAKV